MILGPVNHGYDRNNLEHEAMPQSDLRVAIGGELRGLQTQQNMPSSDRNRPINH